MALQLIWQVLTFVPMMERPNHSCRRQHREGVCSAHISICVVPYNDVLSQIWSTINLAPLYVLHPYLQTEAGDLFSLAWSPNSQTIYIGCQNTSLQWFDFKAPAATSETGITTPCDTTRRPHKFFDSYPRYERRPADIHASNGIMASLTQDLDAASFDRTLVPLASLRVPMTNVVDSAHHGYIYCLALLPSSQEGLCKPMSDLHKTDQLVTGSGDETVKVRIAADHQI
jgi:di- and tripeptidase